MTEEKCELLNSDAKKLIKKYGGVNNIGFLYNDLDGVYSNYKELLVVKNTLRDKITIVTDQEFKRFQRPENFEVIETVKSEFENPYYKRG